MFDRFKKSFKAPFMVFVLQISMVAVIIVSVTAIKFLGGDMYTDLKQWYILNFEDETNAAEVIEPSQIIDENTEQIIEPITEETQLVTPTVSEKITNMSTGKTQVSSVNALCIPLQNALVTSEFGGRKNPITKKSENHKGLDLSAPEGSSIYAATEGIVEISQRSSSYGNYIVINHGNGLKNLYAHCSKLLVNSGDQVKKGQVIAKVGSTGQSTRPHLHFEVLLNDQNLNPSWLINW